MSDFTGLAIAGRIATPTDADWDEARLAWNLVADQRPEAVAFVESAEDIAKVTSFAGENDLRVAGQGTGHGAVAVGSLEGTILIKTERMRGIEVDPDAQTARVEAGVLVLELSEAARPPRPQLAAGLLARRRRDRLHARRWPELARAGAMASPATASARSSWSRRMASSARSTPRTTPTSSGRCAVAVAATRSSPPCSSTWSRSPRSTPARWSSRPRSAPRRSALTATGRRASPMT